MNPSIEIKPPITNTDIEANELEKSTLEIDGFYITFNPYH